MLKKMGTNVVWCMVLLLVSGLFGNGGASAAVDCPPLAGAQGVENARLDAARPTEICKLLTNKTASEKAQIKSREIAKRDFKGEYTNTQYGVRVEIIGEVKEININGQSGIELFAKAWSGGKQLGFGKDGSVEIERFRIFNPPILVEDINGTIIRERTDSITKEVKQRKLREDPIEAIRQVIAHNVKLVGKENANIVIGKIGNTTSTFYPDAHPESTSHDAMMASYTRSSWATAHDDTEAQYINDNYAGPDRFVYSGKDGANFKIVRFQTLFDTSPIGSDTVSSATASLYVNSVSNGDNDGDDYIAVVSSNPASNTGMALGDYSLMGTTAYSNTIDLSSMSTGGYVDWTINATGLAAINTSGITKFGFREGHDIINSAYAGAYDTTNSIVTYAAEQAGTTNDPKLVVVHSASTATPTPTPTPTPTDTTAPSGSVSINNGDSYANSTTVTLNLSATDNVGVVGYYASTSSSTPTASASGWNSVTSTTSYSGSVSYTLASGDEQKTVYVWYKDAAGNVSSAASDSIILDTTAPIITITSPTSSDTYTTTSSPLSLGGSASDTTSGVKEVTWGNDKGGSGTASGTTYWSVSSISLTSGENKITVTAKDNAGNTSADTITVTYNAGSAPTVTTGSATNVTATSATLTGTINANGLSTTAWFEYGTVKGTYGNKTTTQTVTGSIDTTVSITITGLTAGTTYYYRIAAQNNSGTSYGSEMSFQYSSPGSAPTVTTESATDVTTTTATLNGTVNANGISTTAWFEYGTLSGTYGNKTTTKSVSGSTNTKVSIGISGLTSGTTYYFRVVAQNSAGTSYGKEMSFYYSTETKAPTVATEAATNVTDTSATLNGKCNPNGLSTTAWFEYGTLSGTYAYKTSTQSMSGSSYTNVSAAITGLTAGTTYYYRIVAKNSVGTSYGTEMEFYKSPGTGTTPTPVTTPTPTKSPVPTLPPLPTPAPTLPPLPTPQVSPSPIQEGIVFGFVNDQDEQPLKRVAITITGKNSSDSTETDENGYYEFTGLSKGDYTLTYEKEGYQTQSQDISLKEGEAKDLGTVTMEQVVKGKISGYVTNIKGDPIESVRLKLKGIKTKVIKTASSDADGFFEFTDLDADTYVIFATKKGYKKTQQKVVLGDGDSTEIEIEMKKTSKRVIEMMEDGQ